MPLITPQTAAELAAKSHEARRRNKELREQSDTEPQPIPQTEPIALDFAAQRLSRVRTQLDRIDALAAEETDPKQLKFLADAAGRLQEQERQLAGRPLPGTLKPSAKPPRRPEPMPEPTPAIQPVVVQPTPEQQSKPNTV